MILPNIFSRVEVILLLKVIVVFSNAYADAIVTDVKHLECPFTTSFCSWHPTGGVGVQWAISSNVENDAVDIPPPKNGKGFLFLYPKDSNEGMDHLWSSEFYAKIRSLTLSLDLYCGKNSRFEVHLYGYEGISRPPLDFQEFDCIEENKWHYSLPFTLSANANYALTGKFVLTLTGQGTPLAISNLRFETEDKPSTSLYYETSAFYTNETDKPMFTNGTSSTRSSGEVTPLNLTTTVNPSQSANSTRALPLNTTKTSMFNTSKEITSTKNETNEPERVTTSSIANGTLFRSEASIITFHNTSTTAISLQNVTISTPTESAKTLTTPKSGNLTTGQPVFVNISVVSTTELLKTSATSSSGNLTTRRPVSLNDTVLPTTKWLRTSVTSNNGTVTSRRPVSLNDTILFTTRWFRTSATPNSGNLTTKRPVSLNDTVLSTTRWLRTSETPKSRNSTTPELVTLNVTVIERNNMTTGIPTTTKILFTTRRPVTDFKNFTTVSITETVNTTNSEKNSSTTVSDDMPFGRAKIISMKFLNIQYIDYNITK